MSSTIFCSMVSFNLRLTLPSLMIILVIRMSTSVIPVAESTYPPVLFDNSFYMINFNDSDNSMANSME